MEHQLIQLNGCRLRFVTINDYQFIQNLFSVADVKKYYVLRDDHAANLMAFTQYMAQGMQRGDGLNYIIEDSYGNKVGLITAELMRANNGQVMWNVGYAVHSSYRRRGFASTALTGLSNYLTNHFSVQLVSLDICDSNKDSEGVAKKCGFRKPTGGPNVGYIDPDHFDLGFRYKWYRQPSGRIALFNQASQYARGRDYVAAIEMYKKALAEPYIQGTPHTDAQIYSNMGMCYSSIRQYQTAFEYLTKAKRMGLTNPSIEKELLWLRNNVGLY